MCRVLGCDGVKAEGKRKTQTTHGDCYSSSSCNSRAHTRTETTIPRSTANDLFQRGPGPLSSMGRVILQPCWGCRGSIVGCGSDNSRASTVSVSNFSASARRTLYGFVGKVSTCRLRSGPFTNEPFVSVGFLRELGGRHRFFAERFVKSQAVADYHHPSVHRGAQVINKSP